MTDRRKRTRRGENGMTLIEISVAITILSVVVALMYQVIDGTIRGAEMNASGCLPISVMSACFVMAQ